MCRRCVPGNLTDLRQMANVRTLPAFRLEGVKWRSGKTMSGRDGTVELSCGGRDRRKISERVKMAIGTIGSLWIRLLVTCKQCWAERLAERHVQEGEEDDYQKPGRTILKSRKSRETS